MTIGQLLKEGEAVLTHRSARRLEVEVLLAWLLDISKEQLFCSYDESVSDDTIERFHEYVDQLREGRPLAYIMHEREFYGRKFYVDERVLIPRPETEWLVEKGMELSRGLSSGASPLSLVDIGTGSGAIGLSLAAEIPSANVVLADISAEALDVVKMNADRLGICENVDFFVSDLLNNLFDHKFDIIVANLPYIGVEKFHFIAADVEKYEPHVALFGGVDGLQLYKKLFQQIDELPYTPKYLLGEYGFAQTEALELLLSTFFVHKKISYKTFQDLAGIDRYFAVSFDGLPL